MVNGPTGWNHVDSPNVSETLQNANQLQVANDMYQQPNSSYYQPMMSSPQMYRQPWNTYGPPTTMNAQSNCYNPNNSWMQTGNADHLNGSPYFPGMFHHQYGYPNGNGNTSTQYHMQNRASEQGRPNNHFSYY